MALEPFVVPEPQHLRNNTSNKKQYKHQECPGVFRTGNATPQFQAGALQVQVR
jgi:hypothetical protein